MFQNQLKNLMEKDIPTIYKSINIIPDSVNRPIRDNLTRISAKHVLPL